MNLISNTNLSLVSGGNAEIVAFEMCLNVTNTFVETFMAASSAEQQTAIFNAFMPKVEEVCKVAAFANIAKFAEHFMAV